jgi:DNA-binding response OmpR family regulator
MSKPFEAIELIARVKAHLRRSRMLENSSIVDQPAAEERKICYPGLTIDLNRYSVTVDEKNILLSPKEFQLLALLAQNPDNVFSNEQLYTALWGTDNVADYRTVMVHISNIRKKIEKDPKKPAFLHTVKGFGYQFRAV